MCLVGQNPLETSEAIFGSVEGPLCPPRSIRAPSCLFWAHLVADSVRAVLLGPVVGPSLILQAPRVGGAGSIEQAALQAAQLLWALEDCPVVAEHQPRLASCWPG